MKNLGPIHYCLEIEFKQNLSKRTITMSQRKYVNDVLLRFNMDDCNPVSTPVCSNDSLKNPCPMKSCERMYLTKT